VLVGTIIVGGAALYGRRRHGDLLFLFKKLRVSVPGLLVYFSFIVIYYGVIIGVTMFGKVVIVDRVFIPILAASIVLIVSIIGFAWKTKNRWVRVLVLLISLYLSGFLLINSVGTISQIREQGLGLGRKSFQKSEALQAFKELDDGYTIYSNYPWALYLHTGVIGYRINRFSPQEIVGKNALVVIYSYESVQNPVFAVKYGDYLELLESSKLVSLYRYKSK